MISLGLEWTDSDHDIVEMNSVMVPWGYVLDVYGEDNGIGPILETYEGALVDDGSGMMKCYN